MRLLIVSARVRTPPIYVLRTPSGELVASGELGPELYAEAVTALSGEGHEYLTLRAVASRRGVWVWGADMALNPARAWADAVAILGVEGW